MVFFMRKIASLLCVCSLFWCMMLMSRDHALQSVSSFEQSRESMLRLHVVAESNSETDQAEKLLVRDAVLELLEAELQSVSSQQEAKCVIESRMEDIIRVAERTCDLPVTATLCREDFPSIAYNGQIVPRGEYLALRIVIGQGQGRNWWCVLFPPLCYADVQYDETMEVDAGIPQELEIRWFLKEWLEERK